MVYVTFQTWEFLNSLLLFGYVVQAFICQSLNQLSLKDDFHNYSPVTFLLFELVLISSISRVFLLLIVQCVSNSFSKYVCFSFTSFDKNLISYTNNTCINSTTVSMDIAVEWVYMYLISTTNILNNTWTNRHLN